MAAVVFPESGDLSSEQAWGGLIGGLLGNGNGVSTGGPGVVLGGLVVSGSGGLNASISAGEAIVGPYHFANDTAQTLAIPASSTRFVCLKASLDGAGLLTGIAYTAETVWPTDTATAKYVPLARVVTGASDMTGLADTRRMYANPPMLMTQTHLVPGTGWYLDHSPFAMHYNAQTAARYFNLALPPLNTLFDSATENPYKWLFVKIIQHSHNGGAVSLLPSASWAAPFASKVVNATVTTWRISADGAVAFDQNPALTFRVTAASTASTKLTAVGILTNDYNLIPNPTHSD